MILIVSARFGHGAYIFGYILHNPIPNEKMLRDADSLNAESDIDDTYLSDEPDINREKHANNTSQCTQDLQCQKLNDSQMFCDSHSHTCDFVRTEGKCSRILHVLSIALNNIFSSLLIRRSLHARRTMCTWINLHVWQMHFTASTTISGLAMSNH